MSLRTSDNISEKAVAIFLDRHFYPKYTKNVNRFEDKETQMKGVDITFDYKDLTKLVVDEKTNAHYVNKNLPTFAFELSFFTNRGELVEGWLFDSNKVTEYYLLSWIWATKDKGFTENDITELEVILVERSKIIQMLESHGVTKAIAMNRAKELRNQNIPGQHDKGNGIPFYYYLTMHLDEKPLNIIIYKNELIRLSIEHQFIKREQQYHK